MTTRAATENLAQFRWQAGQQVFRWSIDYANPAKLEWLALGTTGRILNTNMKRMPTAISGQFNPQRGGVRMGNTKPFPT